MHSLNRGLEGNRLFLELHNVCRSPTSSQAFPEILLPGSQPLVGTIRVSVCRDSPNYSHKCHGAPYSPHHAVRGCSAFRHKVGGGRGGGE